MESFVHSVRLDKTLCVGCTNCVKRCPTGAIRVRHGSAYIIKELCTDCGECIRICPYHAKSAVMDPLSIIDKFKYAIALPAPSLYAQFNNLTSVTPIISALHTMGFADVFEVAKAAEIVSDMTKKVIAQRKVTSPAISSACPVVVRLIRVRFPNLINNILPVLPPVEVAARLAKESFCKRNGCCPEDVGTVFISPCAAKATACRDPLGFDKSEVDAIVSMKEIYPRLLKHMRAPSLAPSMATAGQAGMGWGVSGGESDALKAENYLAADGIENIIHVLEGLEDEKINGIDFVELDACSGGCVGGILTVENPYVAKTKLKRLKRSRPEVCNTAEGLPERPLMFDHPVKFCDIMRLDEDMGVAMEKMAMIDEVEKRLYGMDCGACGAPSCRAMADDIVRGKATEDMCIYKIKEELAALSRHTVPERRD